MKRVRTDRQKALAAAQSVVLAANIGCHVGRAPLAHDSALDTGDLTDTAAPTDTPEVDIHHPRDRESCSSTPEPPDCSDLEMWECCDVLFEWCSEHHELNSLAFSDCVYGSADSGPSGCTPWGPPVPPAFEA